LHDRQDCPTFTTHISSRGGLDDSTYCAGCGSFFRGNLPSLKADASGTASIRFESTTLSLGSGKTDVLGRGLIVHRDADDYTTQPTGNSGPRVACGVIART